MLAKHLLSKQRKLFSLFLQNVQYFSPTVIVKINHLINIYIKAQRLVRCRCLISMSFLSSSGTLD